MNVYQSLASQNPALIPPSDDLDLTVYTDEELRRLVVLEKARIRHNAEISLYEFYRDYAWPAVEGDKPFVPNWHLEAIADHLEAVSAGEIKRLVVNVPFRTSKSTLVSVAWPAWIWLSDPSYQWLCGSFASRLAIRDALKMRRLVTSPAYQRDFGDRFRMSEDQNQKVKFENDKGGYRIAFGFTGAVLGDGGDCCGFTTIVQTQMNGSAEIGELVNSGQPVKVWSVDPVTLKPAFKSVTKFYRRPASPMIRIWTPRGDAFDFTPNHLFLTTEGWVRADELTTDHRVTCSDFESETTHQQMVLIQHGHHADETFCLDVEDNHTFCVGNIGAVVHNCVLIDDPQDRQGANSDAERETTLTTFDEAISTRLNDPATSPMVIIMQRLHQLDLSGHVLKNKADGWQHLMLPMEFEPTRACSTSIGFKDPRTVDGELLWPERFPAQTVKALTRTLGSYGAAGQLQQRPAPAGGGIYKVTKFRMWPHNKPLPDFFFCVQSYDTAFTSKTENDPTGCQVWGVFEHEKRRNVLLLDCWNEHLDYPALKAKVMEDWGAKYGGVKNDPMKPSRKPDEIIIEEKGSGISLIQDLRRANIPIFSYNPGRADKVARAYMITPIIEGDVVWVMESKREPGRPISWARPMLTQLEQFPNGEHDEMSDCISQALARLRDLQQLDYDVVPDDEEVDRDYHENARRAVNPYA